MLARLRLTDIRLIYQRETDKLDYAEMERCFQLQIDAGVDGFMVAGSLSEGPMLSHDEKIEVLKTAQKIATKKPRQPRAGARRKAVEKIVNEALATRPKLPKF